MYRRPVRFWVDTEGFRRIETLLRRAKHTIIIQMFIWKDDATGRRMAQALVRAADRGVQIFITKEVIGDMFELSRDFLTTRGSRDDVWHRFWNHSNIRVAVGLHEDHAKVFVIDDSILLLTGMNIATEYEHEWHDFLVELRGSHFVRQYLTEEEPSVAALKVGPLKRKVLVRLVMNKGRRREIRSTVMGLLRGARDTVVLEQAYFSDPEIIDLLIAKSNEGVRVTLILPGTSNIHQNSNMQSILRLLREGAPRRMQIFLYPRMLHGKLILVDHVRAFLGSANLITTSLDQMGEVCVMIEGKPGLAIMKLRDMIRDDLLASKALLSPPHFGWIGKWLAWFGL